MGDLSVEQKPGPFGVAHGAGLARGFDLDKGLGHAGKAEEVELILERLVPRDSEPADRPDLVQMMQELGEWPGSARRGCRKYDAAAGPEASARRSAPRPPLWPCPLAFAVVPGEPPCRNELPSQHSCG